MDCIGRFRFSTLEHEKNFRKRFGLGLQMDCILLSSSVSHHWNELLKTHDWLESFFHQMEEENKDNVLLSCIKYAPWTPSKGIYYFHYIISEEDDLWMHVDFVHRRDWVDWQQQPSGIETRTKLYDLRTHVVQYESIRRKDVNLCLLEHLNIPDLCNIVLFRYCGFLFPF